MVSDARRTARGDSKEERARGGRERIDEKSYIVEIALRTFDEEVPLVN